MTYTQQVAKHCKDLHPEAATDSDAVFAYQKDLQQSIELKKKLNLPAADEITLWFELFEVWNELKALELSLEHKLELELQLQHKLEHKNGGSNVNLSNSSDSVFSLNDTLVCVGN